MFKISKLTALFILLLAIAINASAQSTSQPSFSPSAGSSSIIAATNSSVAGNIVAPRIPAGTSDKLQQASIANKASVTDNNVDPEIANGTLDKQPPLTTNNTISIIQRPFSSIIKVPLKEGARLATFIRGSRLWIVFDEYKQFDCKGIEQGNSLLNRNNYWIKSFNQQITDTPNSYLIFELYDLPNKTPFISINNDNGNWVFEIGEQDLQSVQKINIISDAKAFPAPRVEVDIDEEIDGVNFIDPYVGDSILIIPVKTLRKAIPKEHNFVEFNILSTIQGAVVQKISDSVAYSINGDKLYIISDDTTLSSPVVKSLPKIYTFNIEDKFLENTDNSKSILDFTPFKDKDKSKDFNYEIYKMMHSLFNMSKEDKAIAHKNLALFYIANGFYREASIMLKMIKDFSYDYYYSYKIRFIEAIAYFLNEKYIEALKTISVINTANIPINHREEIRFWQSIISAAAGDEVSYTLNNSVGSTFSDKKNNFLSGYTPDILIQLAIVAINDRIINKQFKIADQIIKSSLRIKGASNLLKNRLDYVIAKYYLSQNQFKAATTYLDRCISDIDDKLNRTLCKFEKLKFQINTKQIIPNQAMNDLEELSYIWRGDQIEINILEYLGNLYQENKEPIKALNTWNKIIKYYPNTHNAISVQKSMSDTFIEFFMTNQDQQLSPLNVLSIFYKYKDLVPIGPIGDKIIGKFIDNLTHLDLLDRAAAILNFQILNRLTGLDREEAINKLAKINIKNLKPDQALQVIDLGDKDFPLVPAIIERKYIKAEALYLTHHYNRAIELLQNDYSQKADDIKTEIYWDLGNWAEFNNHSEPYLYSIINSKEQLTEDQIKRVLRQAVSYIMLNRKDLLAELYENFKDRMPVNTPYPNVLNILAESLLSKSKNNIISASDIAKYKAIVDNLVKQK